MPEVQSFLKERIDCGCGCGRYGPPRKNPWPNGVVCATNCDPSKGCRQCRGAKSRSKGKAKQRAAAKAAAVPRHAATHEESFRGAIRMEVKAEKRIADPIWNRFLEMEAQAAAAKPLGDPRPFIAAVCPDDTSEMIMMFRSSQIDAVVTALAENLWGI